MSHVKVIENVRLEVTPWYPSFRAADTEYQKKAAEDIVKQIKRHIDDINDVSVVWDTRYVCEFCGYDLTDESARVSDLVPIECCDEEIVAWLERHPEHEATESDRQSIEFVAAKRQREALA